MSTLYATFIGINNYPGHPLRGCVKDVLEVDALLKEQCAQQHENPLAYSPMYFLSPDSEDEKLSIPAEYEEATFHNISTKAFRHLKQARTGDICVLYYSGHGSQTDAPKEFWHTKSDRQNETIVCVDSRTPGNRDLIDKELGYLIWDALEGKEVHCLVIMDCCHAGHNMRGQESSNMLRYRHEQASHVKVPVEEYIGFDDPRNFYDIKKEKASISIARYVQLSAAQDFELAQETPDGGLFTSRLIEFLRNGGTARSYHNIIQSLSITVNGRASKQHPVIFATDKEDMDLRFLGKGVTPYQPSYEVKYDSDRNKWVLHGGAMHGLVASYGASETIVKLLGPDKLVKVVAVDAVTAILDQAEMSSFSDRNKQYQAVITERAGARISISISPSLEAVPAVLYSLKEAYGRAPRLYYRIDFNNENTVNDYAIRLAKDGTLQLTGDASDIPLFVGGKNPVLFLKDVESLGAWSSVAELKNTGTALKETDFVLTTETLEGYDLKTENADQEKGNPLTVQSGDEVVLEYKDSIAPGFRLNIAIDKNASLAECFVGVLYLNSKYGIDSALVQESAGRLTKGGSPVALKCRNPKTGKEQVSIPVFIDKLYYDYGINEITDILKIFISTQPLALKRFDQQELKLEPLGTRALNLVKTTSKPGWTVFTLKLRIKGMHKEKVLKSAAPAEFSAFTVSVPAGFEARAVAVTDNDLQFTTRSMSKLPNPFNIWAGAMMERAPFGEGLSAAAGNGIQALEILPDKNNKLAIPENEFITIRPKATPAVTRSADGLEEMTVPYGYNKDTQLYYPLGYSDEAGVIKIRELPPPTPGTLSDNNLATRSLGSSVKLYFAKLFRQPPGGLVLYRIENSGEWTRLTNVPEEMKPYLSVPQSKRIILLIHGIIGDTKSMVAAFKAMQTLREDTAYVLTYDYENLATAVPDTAKLLYQHLLTAGLRPGAGITIIAHSMGGLVARYMIEFEGGDALVCHLILAGTPSKGSEMARFGKIVCWLVTHAMNVTGPVKYALPGLSFLLKRLELDPLNTLSGMAATSDIIERLKKSGVPDKVHYSILGGDTEMLENEYDGDDHFLQKLSGLMKHKLLYPGISMGIFDELANDMAVTTDSMKGIEGLREDALIEIVASDHISYFQEPACLELFLSYLRAFNCK